MRLKCSQLSELLDGQCLKWLERCSQAHILHSLRSNLQCNTLYFLICHTSSYVHSSSALKIAVESGERRHNLVKGLQSPFDRRTILVRPKDCSATPLRLTLLLSPSHVPPRKLLVRAKDCSEISDIGTTLLTTHSCPHVVDTSPALKTAVQMDLRDCSCAT
jgi:hypothetical protein